MKRVLFFFVFLSGISFAQSNHSLGLVFGPNHFSLRGSDFLDDAKSNYAVFYGFSYEYKFNKHLSLVTGLTLEQKRINYNSKYSLSSFNEFGEFITNDFSLETKNRYQYFSLPLLLKYKIGEHKSFFINGGFFIATTGKNKKTTRITNQTMGYSYTTSTKEAYNFPFADDIDGFDYGISFGVGKSFNLNSKMNLLIELRDNLGLVNAISGINYGGVTGDIKTNTLNLIAQFSFEL